MRLILRHPHDAIMKHQIIAKWANLKSASSSRKGHGEGSVGLFIPPTAQELREEREYLQLRLAKGEPVILEDHRCVQEELDGKCEYVHQLLSMD
jgi:hypothetical protein